MLNKFINVGMGMPYRLSICELLTEKRKTLNQKIIYCSYDYKSGRNFTQYKEWKAENM